MAVLLKFDPEMVKDDEGFVHVTTQHFRPDLLSSEKQKKFDMKIESLPETPGEGSYSLYAKPESGELKWVKKEIKEDDEDDD